MKKLILSILLIMSMFGCNEVYNDSNEYLVTYKHRLPSNLYSYSMVSVIGNNKIEYFTKDDSFELGDFVKMTKIKK